MTKYEKLWTDIFGYCWVISWFIAMWVPIAWSMRFFLTGAFSVMLAIGIYENSKKE